MEVVKDLEVKEVKGVKDDGLAARNFVDNAEDKGNVFRSALPLGSSKNFFNFPTRSKKRRKKQDYRL